MENNKELISQTVQGHHENSLQKEKINLEGDYKSKAYIMIPSPLLLLLPGWPGLVRANAVTNNNSCRSLFLNPQNLWVNGNHIPMPSVFYSFYFMR
jgi:hypothetical protein